jgi:hypothetical protein
MHSVRLTPGTPAANSHIEIDGHDISKAVRRVTLDIPANADPPELRIELAHVEYQPIDMTDAKVVITEPSREALIALGWTPPAEES